MPRHIRKEVKQHERQTPIARERFKHGKALRGLTILAALIGMPCSSNSQTPADDVAAQVRSQGYRCDHNLIYSEGCQTFQTRLSALGSQMPKRRLQSAA